MELRARPLSLSEIQEFLLRARGSGFLGNPELSDYLVERGLSRDRKGQHFVRKDHLMVANAAREVWILTLNNLADYTRNLAETLGTKLRLQPRRYSYSDLATPGYLFHLSEDLKRLDTERYVRALFDEIIVGGREGDRRLDREDARQKFWEHADIGIQRILGTTSGEEKPFSALPDSVLPSPSEKCCAYRALMNTPDWNQYAEILFVFNSLTNTLTFHSNQLGGLDTSIWEAKLVTGSPGIFELIKPLEYPPAYVCAAVIGELASGKSDRLSGRLQSSLSKNLAAAQRQTRNDLEGKQNPEPSEVAVSLLNHFARPLRNKHSLLNQLAFAYWPEFSAHMDREREQLAESFASDYRTFSQPDCYVLVEGPSDKICFSQFVRIEAGPDLRIRVLDCQSCSRLVQRYRDLVHQGFLGGIVTIVDADAQDEHAELKRLPSGSCTVRHFINSRGALEDLFSVQMHNAALELQFPGDPRVMVAQPKGGGLILNELKRATWETRSADFSKVDHARALLTLIEAKTKVPQQAREWIEAACEIAKKTGAAHPRPASHLSVDARSREFAHQWSDKILAPTVRKAATRAP